MAKSAIARVRMEPADYDRFSRLAQEAGKDLGPYLLERLLEVERLDQRLETLHRSLARIEAQGAGAGNSPNNQVQGSDGMLLEMLLLIRQIAGPQKATLAGAEVARNGLVVWQGV